MRNSATVRGANGRKGSGGVIERHYSLRRAAELIGVSRPTVKKWLREDLGLMLPRVERGSKVLLSGRQIEFLLKRRTARKVA